MILRRFAVSALPLILMLSLIGCSSGSHGSQADTSSAATPSAPGGPPDPELYQPLMKQCLSGFGYDVTFLDDGGISVNYADPKTPPDELAKLTAQYNKALKECLHKTGFDKVAHTEPKADWKQQAKVDDCIRAAGYPVKSPTWEEFQRGIVSDRASVLPTDLDKLTALKKKCGF